MAKTKIADIIVPEVFLPYMQEQTIYKNQFFRSGVIARNAAIQNAVEGGGKTFQMPYFKSIVGSYSSEVLSDSADLTVQKITTGQQDAVRLNRGLAFSVNDLAGILAGADPMEAIARELGEAWAHDYEDIIISILTGVFADNVANDSSDLVHDITVSTGDYDTDGTDANLISAVAMNKARFLLGDHADKFVAIAVHSDVYNSMLDQNLISFVPLSEQGQEIRKFNGLDVIVCDNLPTAAEVTSGTEYTSYLFQRGTIAYGEDNRGLGLETDRDILAGDDIITTRRILCFHPSGFSFQSSSIAGSSPTNAELNNAVEWDRVFEKKNCGIVQLLSNG